MPEQHELKRFLYREARLLDTGRFEEWLALFTEDALYWAPAGHDDIDPTRHVSIIHDDKAALARRIRRLRSGHAYAQDPASRTHRLVSNVEAGAYENDVLEVHSVMLLVELARHRQTIHSARCVFTLLKTGEGWMIRRKKINLLRNNEPLEATAFLL